MAKKAAKKSPLKYAIVGGPSYGLYYGLVSPDEVNKSHDITVTHCRHIAYWKGPRGGITALAQVGPDNGSRIGVACASTRVNNVAAVHFVSDKAAKKFAEVHE
jgi:hypothetical protein